MEQERWASPMSTMADKILFHVILPVGLAVGFYTSVKISSTRDFKRSADYFVSLK